MDTDSRSRFQAAMELADRALDLPDAEREKLLESCADPELRREVQRILDADARAGDFLSSPAAQRLDAALGADGGSFAQAGQQVGPFRLVSLVGKGGMGEVWVGVREGADFEQKAAVKLLHTGGNVAALALRFRRERQILARLTHPCIARLLDGGVTKEGQPWLAMELVEGKELTAHCAARALGVEERLRLFVQVCDAVQFAHRNLVVHRDLKPANILVTPNGEVKLLDFGIAKLLLGEEEQPTALTQTGERPMTPDYAAPEQVRGGSVTTATDVWALGIVLHELLTGVRPYRSAGKNRLEVERAILEAAPSRPSSSVDASKENGRPPSFSTRALRRRLQGDLDAIVLKALRREPEDRYPSAEALTADVRRHLEGRPVIARGDATGYIVRSFVRRYRVGVGFSALALAALLVGLVGTLWQAHRARQEAQKAEQTQEFLIGMLEAFDPYQQGGKAVTQQAILDRGEARVNELAAQPEVEGRLLRVFAQTWCNIGDLARGKEAAERALVLERSTVGARSIEVAKTLLVVGQIGNVGNDLTTSGQAYAEALSIARDAEGPEGPTAIKALGGVALTARGHGDFAESERLYRQQLEICRRLHGPEHVDTVEAMGELALPMIDEGRLEESRDILRETARLSEKARGADHPDTLLVRANLARSLIELGQNEEADGILRDVLARQAAVVGESSPYALYALLCRARALDGLGRSGDALPLLEQVLRGGIELGSANTVGVATTLGRESVVLRHLRRLEEAEATARRALAIQAERLGENHTTAWTRSALGSALLDEGRIDEARTELSRALAVQEKFLLPTHPDLVTTRAELARAEAASAP